MDRHIRDYFYQFNDDTSPGVFFEVIALHEKKDITWSKILKIVPNLPKGWFELSKLPSKDRIEFLCQFWISKLPFHPNFHEFVISFFSKLDDIGIFITKKTKDKEFVPQLIYSLKNNQGFYNGFLPATDQEIANIQSLFSDTLLPKDYLAFLEIHNGFSKYLDTGIFPIEFLKYKHDQFVELLTNQEPLILKNNELINSESLIPFYQSFNTNCYQCFWKEWYPQDEMGNIYYSEELKTIIEPNKGKADSTDMTFSTFSDWLVFYLEGVE